VTATTQPVPVLIVLHGYEDEPGGRIDPSALDGWRVVTPRGPIERPGGPAWFASDDDGPVSAHLVHALDQLDELVGREAQAGSRVVVGGYSQGGAVALALALRAERRSAADLRGVFCVNGWLPHDDAVTYDPTRLVAAGTPALIVASEGDEVVPVQSGRSAARVLERGGVAVTYVEVPGDHHPGLDAFSAVADWLDALA
jgi:predicted esterase